MAFHRLSRMCDEPLLQAQVLLANTLNRPRSWILAHPETSISIDQQNLLLKNLARLEMGEPMPYITGRQEFFSLPFYVTPDVLIPRPETEILVEEALRWLSRQVSPQRIIDVGTGSSCIALSIAYNTTGHFIIASDISLNALHVARTNLSQHQQMKNVQLALANLLQPFLGPFDLLLANLPYIPSQKLEKLAVAKHEPILALDGGEDGLLLIRKLLEQARTRLSSTSLILLEIEYSQEQSASNIAKDIFPEADIRVINDLSGMPRILRIERRLAT